MPRAELAVIECSWGLVMRYGVHCFILCIFYIGSKVLHNKKQNKNYEVDTIFFFFLYMGGLAQVHTTLEGAHLATTHGSGYNSEQHSGSRRLF